MRAFGPSLVDARSITVLLTAEKTQTSPVAGKDVSQDRLACAGGCQLPAALAALNRAPLAHLAECGVRHGVSFGRAFVRAQRLIDHRNAGHRIEADEARRLCRAMRSWAQHPSQSAW